MNGRAQKAYLQGRGFWIGLGLMLAVVVLLATAMTFFSSRLTSPASAAPADEGFRDYRYTDEDSAGVDRTDTTGREVFGPTSDKPQSKLWFNDGSWWGVLFNPDASGDGRYEIYRYNGADRTWSATGIPVDERNDSRADALWDKEAGKLYVVSSGPRSNDAATDEANRGVFRSYNYNASTNTYAPAGEAIPVTDSGVEALVLERDSTGQFWVTFTRNNRVRVNRSLDETGRTWGDPFFLTVAGADTLSSDDISSIIAFDGKVGVMWSNQNADAVYFATHADSNDDDTAFVAEDPPINRPNGADDHINLKSLQAGPGGRVFAAVKTSATEPDDAQTLLLARNPDGTFEEHVFGTVADDHTRPIVLIDEQNKDLYVFAAAPTGGGSIFYKKTPLADISFEPGRGTPFIQSDTDTKIDDPTSTKQNLNGATDLLVQASDRESDFYLHNHMDLADNAKPTVTNVRPTPGSKTRDRSPRVKATVRDAETELSKRDIDLFLDGKKIAASRFAYNAETDRLAYNSGRLSYGRHKVKVVATDAQGASGSKAWRFTVKRRR